MEPQLTPLSDPQLIDLWLHGRPATTQRAYRADVARFRTHLAAPLAVATLSDLQAFADSLTLAPASRRRILSAVRSLLTFGHREAGALDRDAGAALRLPPLPDTLAQRILPELDVQRMIVLTESPRDRALLLLFYGAGLRVSELCSLSWRDLQARETGGQVAVMGKGSKPRTVLLSAGVWQALLELPGDAGEDAPVFRSRTGRRLEPSRVRRIVRQAARRAGIRKAVSPHWLRHCHASHALDRGAPISLVQQTLGHASVATTGKYLHARPDKSSGQYLPV